MTVRMGRAPTPLLRSTIDILSTTDDWATSNTIATVRGSIIPNHHNARVGYANAYDLTGAPSEYLAYVERVNLMLGIPPDVAAGVTVSPVNNRLLAEGHTYRIQSVRDYGTFLELYVDPVRE